MSAGVYASKRKLVEAERYRCPLAYVRRQYLPVGDFNSRKFYLSTQNGPLGQGSCMPVFKPATTRSGEMTLQQM